jgi:RND superfamily putative drug exporter
MERLAGFAQRHHWAALACWVVLLLGVTVAAQGIGSAFSNGSGVSLPGTQSAQLAELLARNAPEQTGDSVTVVLHDERGWDTEVDVHALTRELASVDRVRSVRPPSPQQGTVSPDGTLGLVQVALEGEQGSAPRAVYQRLIDVSTMHATDHVQVELSGKGIRKLQQGSGGIGEGVGLLAALIILVIMFGSLLAASLPLITAVFAVGSTVGIVALISHVMAIPDFTSGLLLLVGLGVGIDYALLVFSRFRSELLLGATREQATRRSLDTAGRSVLFAGASVIIALLGMFALRIALFEGTVTAVSLTVLVTMVASLTLLPALLTLFGSRIEKSVRRHAVKARREPGAVWRRWAGRVQRSPWPALVLAVVALGALAAPALGMRLGFNDAGNDPAGSTSRVAYDLVSAKLGPGANGPLLVVTEGSRDAAEAVRAKVQAVPGIVRNGVTQPVPLSDGTYLMRAQPTTGPQDAATTELVTDLRHQLGESALVGGSTAANIDFSQTVADRLPLFLLVVVGLSGLLLMCVFRSLLIALKASVLNLLSIGAALGAMKLVYQDGLLWGHAGPIESFMPVFIFALVFGLSMDYEVFLLSRMREFWLATGDAQHAVREGLAHTGSVITAAAAIMFMVFGAFALLPDRMLQQAGFAMAVAVLLDAAVIRCLVVPAVMRLLGARAWWLPRWLDRLLPQLNVEGGRGASPVGEPAGVTPVGLRTS